MDEAALASIAKSALQLFSSLAKDEFLLLWNSQKDLKRLEATIETISNIHQDTQQRGSNDGSVNHCLAKLRSVMYDAEDLFDGLASQILHKRTTTGNAFTKEVCMFFSDANQLGVIFKTAHAVKAIRESLDDIKKDMEFYGLIRQQPPLVQPFQREKTHSFVHSEDVIGRDEDRDRIIKMLLPQNEGEASDSRSLSVIAIIGFGGLGKTTLAQYVYNNEGVKQGFDVHLWACINDLSNLELVLIEIIASEEVRPSNLGLEKLQEKLRELISGRKFLLVLDDVWDPRNWLKLEPFLRCGKTGSRVLVTTRSRKVAECVGASKPNCCVDLAVLSDESAWSLFVQKAFDRQEEVSEHPELESVGKKIVRMCANVPLAINVIGSLLRGKGRNEKIWSDFLDKEFKVIVSTDGDENHESIIRVLMFSYNDLLPNLKLCFAYCSLFPKDYVFDKDVLVRLWLAQGFIKPCADNERSLEEEGEEYFFHLVERCFFQEVKQKKYDRYQHTAKMHDLLHDVAVDVGKTESLFLDKVSMINKGERDNLRHISLSLDLDKCFDYCSLVSDPKTVRTLVIHATERFSIDTFNMSLGRFRMLRTLHLAWLKIDNISECIGELIHMRYLDLSYNDRLTHLPNSICKLHHLMILVLVNCKLLEELPPKIENLVSLRQLYVRRCERLSCLPSGLTALTSLVNLDRLVVHPRTGGLRYLQCLDNLRGIVTIELPKRGWLDAIEDATKANMSRKSKLSGMIIEWMGKSSEQNMPKDEAKAVLDALEPHTNLEYLNITGYGGEMLSSWFGTLKNVTELRLYRCDQVEYLEDEIKGDLYFPSLKILTLYYLRNLKGWWRQQVDEEAERRPRLPKVSVLRITGCPGLKGRRMPLFEQFEELTLDMVGMELVTELLIENIDPNCSPPFHKNNKLKQLTLAEIDDLMSVPEGWLRHLTQLQKLHIQSCSELKWVSCRGLAHLTALKDLRLSQMGSKIADRGDEDGGMGMTEAGMPWKALKGLESLSVSTMGEHLIEGLEFLTSLKSLEFTNWKDEEEVGVEEREAGQLELSFKALHNLQRLVIGFDDKTARLPKFIQYLPSLIELSISDCKELHLGWKTLLSRKLQRLVSEGVKRVISVEDMVVVQKIQLQDLQIGFAEAEWVDNVPWNSLSSLHSLVLWVIIGMEQLPDGIQHLTSLKRLTISCCEEMRSVPNWIPKLTSLQHLDIRNCSVELTRRCEQGGGGYWPLIRHLPYIEIRARDEGDEELATKDSRGDEEQGEGSNKKGWCGLPLPKFHL